jgi:hypothetical protein
VRQDGGAEFTSWRDVAIWQSGNARAQSGARHIHTTGKHFKHAGKFDDTVCNSWREFYQPANPRQQHHAFYGKTEHESWAESHRFAMRNLAGHAGSSGRLNNPSGFSFNSGNSGHFNHAGNVAVGHALSARDLDRYNQRSSFKVKTG